MGSKELRELEGRRIVPSTASRFHKIFLHSRATTKLPNRDRSHRPPHAVTHTRIHKSAAAFVTTRARGDGDGAHAYGRVLDRDENGRERRENPSTVPETVFFGREWKQERKNRTGKRNRYYGISGTKSIGREHADYDRESITQNGKIHTTTSNI